MIEAIKLVLKGIDQTEIESEDGWWETSDGAEFGAKKLAYILGLLAQPEQEPVAIMREMLEVQGQHGNWNYDSYMHGLYNGMEYMVALAEKREPRFRDAPDEWLAKYEVKRDNFNSTEPLTEATSPQRTWVGLTDKEANELWESTDSDDDWELMKRTEAKLRSKNENRMG